MSVSKTRKLYELKQKEERLTLKAALASDTDRDDVLIELLKVRAKIKSLSA